MLKEKNVEIRQILWFNYNEAFNLIKDSIIIYLRIMLHPLDKNLKAIIKKYFLTEIEKHYSSILRERAILKMMKKEDIAEDDAFSILDELDLLMELRFGSYDKFLAEYEELLLCSAFNKYNYRCLPNEETLLTKRIQESILMRIKKIS